MVRIQAFSYGRTAAQSMNTYDELTFVFSYLLRSTQHSLLALRHAEALSDSMQEISEYNAY